MKMGSGVPQGQGLGASAPTGVNTGYSTGQAGFLGGFGRIQSPQRPPPNPPQGGGGQMSAPTSQVDNTGFKPFYKSSQSMNGGFVSPV
ncbi:unnamed protein product [Callosobruchus maculatus]|uniref:Uncharacterized protein n=2 Tax=Callosobruchus maculatus TaxID=64391 RepID=A0A653DTI8_CALMS|nr:unnamed protein product [Callosobruchus maculatus]